MSDINSVAVIGCGWFGLPLAKRLVAKGYKVTGCKRDKAGTAALADLGIEAFVLDFVVGSPVPQKLFDADAWVINLPPSIGGGGTGYLECLSRLKSAMPRIPKRLFFISSTAVYPESPSLLAEHEAIPYSPAADILLRAEALFSDMNTTIVRFAGLVGPGRHPGRFFAGRTGIAGGAKPVNIVHRDDCIAALETLLSASVVGKCFNLCAPKHPDKASFYSQAARTGGYELPQFEVDDIDGKRVDGNLICRDLGFVYRYPDPLRMLTEAEAFLEK